MLPTRRLVFLFLAGVLIQLAALCYAALHASLARSLPAVYLPDADLVGYSLPIILAYDGWLFLAFLADVVLAHRTLRLRVRRDRPARLSLGVDNEVTLVIENASGGSRRVVIRDQPAPLFRADPGLLDVSVPGYSQVRASYRLLPTERGNYEFGNVYLRCLGPLGLG